MQDRKKSIKRKPREPLDSSKETITEPSSKSKPTQRAEPRAKKPHYKSLIQKQDKTKKHNPYAKALQKWEEVKKVKDAEKEQQVVEAGVRTNKEKKRIEKTRNFRKTTRTGQPMMKFRMLDILEKLQK